MHKRLSMDPNARVKLAKLEWVSVFFCYWLYHRILLLSMPDLYSQALSYMGYDITPQQKQKIRSGIDIDGEGRVVFLEFVGVAKEMFAFRLDDARLEASLVYALTRKDSLELPNFQKKVGVTS